MTLTQSPSAQSPALPAASSRWATQFSASGSSTTRRKPLQVRTLGATAATSAPGGGEIQLAETAKALCERGVDARPWRDEFDRFREIDVLHVFGSLREHLPTVLQARCRGVAVAVSPIAWFDAASRWQEPGLWVQRAFRCGRYALASTTPWMPTWRKRLYRAANVLLPNSDAEQQQLAKRYNLPAAKFRVVPNAASLCFANGDAELFSNTVGGPGYVLIPGRIEPRKNQLGVIRALKGTGLRLVILGDVVPGHEEYAAACREAAGADVSFVSRLQHDDPLLASAYAGCGCVALLSWFETPGLVALEAGMSGIPLALTSRGSTREYFGGRATYGNPADPLSIRAAVKAAMSRDRDDQLANHVRENFTWNKAAEATLAAYEHALWQVAGGASTNNSNDAARVIAD